MRTRKIAIRILLAVVTICIAAGGLCYQGLKKYHRGNFLQLLDFQEVTAEVREAGVEQKVVRQRERLTEPCFFSSLKTDPRRLVVYRTRHVISECEDPIELREGSRRLTYFRDLLNESKVSSGWSYLQPGHFVVMDRGPNSPFLMYGSADVYTDVRRYATGLVRWKIFASGALAGAQLPQLVVQVDDRKIGLIEVRTRSYEPYFVETLLREGLHTLRIQFVNDYYDPDLKLDRNVLISRIEIDNPGTLLLASRADSPINQDYEIDYCTRDQVEPSSVKIDRDGDVRSALLLPAASRITIPLKLPREAQLMFSLASMGGQNVINPVTRFRVTLKPLLGGVDEVFSYTSRQPNGLVGPTD